LTGLQCRRLIIHQTRKGAVAYLYMLDSAAPQMPEARVVISGVRGCFDLSAFTSRNKAANLTAVGRRIARLRSERLSEPWRSLRARLEEHKYWYLFQYSNYNIRIL
jgi:hypothetical protein